MLGYQLQPTLLSNFLRTDGVQLNRLLVQPDKNELRMRRRFATLAADHVFKTAFATPDAGERRDKWEKMRQHDETGPKSNDPCQHCQAMAMEPMHERILAKNAK